MNSAIHLPTVFAIGFTGHRSLPDEALCRKRICDFLIEQKSAQTTIYGVSSVAAGADLLFAESCLELNIPLRVLLPLAREDFRADFDAATWSRAEQVMRHALSVEVVGNDAPRNERYYECGLQTVEQSQLLIAVWNGLPAQGLGGTEEIVTFAGHMGRPVVWIHSVTGEIQTQDRNDWPQSKGDPELKFLNRLPDAETGPAGDSPQAIAEAWLEKLDANAVRAAPQVRKLAAIPIVLTAVAAFVSAAAQHMGSGEIWMTIGAGLGLMAGVLPSILRLKKRQALWVRIRTAAEVSRSFLALWCTPGPYRVVGPDILPELNGMLASLNLLKAQASQANVANVDQFKEQYLKDRLLDQKKYFSHQSLQAAGKARRFRVISIGCIAGAVLLSSWTVLGRFLSGPGHAAWGGNRLSLAASALFQVATIAGALVVVHDCDRRQRRYQELHRAMASWEKEFRALRAWGPVKQTVNRIERALLVELLEWRALLQNTKMP